jgi:hypothetical protein
MTIIEIGVSKFARFSMSSIDMGILDLTAFISYRYVGFSLFTIIMTVLELIGLGFIPYVFLVYFILAESYFYVINLIIIVFGVEELFKVKISNILKFLESNIKFHSSWNICGLGFTMFSFVIYI